MSNLSTFLTQSKRTTVSAGYDRVAMECYGRSYPVTKFGEEGPKYELAEIFRHMPAKVVESLPYAQASTIEESSTSGEKHFGLFHQSLKTLEGMFAEAATLFMHVFKCNVEVRAEWMEDQKKFEAMTAKIDEIKDLLPKFQPLKPQAASIDLYRQADFIIRHHFDNHLIKSVHHLFKVLSDNYDMLVSLEQMGLMHWVCGTACRFHFFKNVITSEIEATRSSSQTTVKEVEEKNEGHGFNRVKRHTTETTTERDIATTHGKIREVHELIGAKNYTIEAATEIERPERVDKLIAKIPRWLMPVMRIVAGTETRRVIIEEELRTNRNTEKELKVNVRDEFMYRHDPALICGHYVLTGWGEEENNLPELSYRKMAIEGPKE